MINPVTNDPFTVADVDRILGLADQLLADWEEDEDDNCAGRSPECIERRKEWDALRPMLLQLVEHVSKPVEDRLQDLKQRKTNEEVINDIMTFSKFGPLAQVFVLDALTKMADRVAMSTLEDYPVNSPINPRAWIGVAKEIQGKLKEHFES